MILNERTCQLVVSDHRRPRPRVTPDRQTGAFPIFKMEVDALFTGIHIVSAWKHQISHSTVPRIQVLRMIIKSVTYCAVRKFGGRYQVKEFLITLHMINAVVNVQRGDVSTQSEIMYLVISKSIIYIHIIVCFDRLYAVCELIE